MNFRRFLGDPDGQNHHKSNGSSPCAIPALQQVMSATKGATDAFSGLGNHVNSTLRRLGAKNIEAGIGGGLGFGGDLAVKPGLMQHIQSCFGVILSSGYSLQGMWPHGEHRMAESIWARAQRSPRPSDVHCTAALTAEDQAMASLIMKFGIVPGLQFGQNVLPGSLQSSMSLVSETSLQNPIGNIIQSASKTMEHTSQGLSRVKILNVGSKYEAFTSKGASVDSFRGTQSEKVVDSFLQNPILKEEDVELTKLVGHLRSENNVLQMVLKHQQIIEELMVENEMLHRILVEELKVPHSKLQVSNSRTKSLSPCSDCFECRRRQRKRK